VLVPHRSMLVPSSTGGPSIWVLPQNEEPQVVVRRFSSTNTLTVRRLLIRPISIFVFGVCVLQASKLRRVLDTTKPQRMVHPSDDTTETMTTTTTDTPCAGMDWRETEPASLSSNTLWSSDRSKQQLPPYPGGWGKQHEPLSPPPVPSEDNPQLYGWEPSLYPDPLVDPVRCGIAYLPPQKQQQQQTPPPPPSSDEDASSSSASPPLPSANENENHTTAAQAKADPDNDDSSSNSNESLRLCDPDWVLGGMYLEEMALALSNFKTLYGDWTTVHSNYWRRQLRSPLQSPLPLPSALPRQLAGSPTEDQRFSIEAASEDGRGYTRKSTGPAIELAVATVRKVG
jgi:hypothetical protein